jgi:hypothetical protein
MLLERRTFESFFLPIPIPGIAPVHVEAKLPFRVETGSFKAEKTGPYRQNFSKAFSAKPAVVVVGYVRAGTLPTPPKPTPTTKVTPPSMPSISPISVPVVTVPPLPRVETPEVKIEPLQARFPIVEVKVGWFACPARHKIGEVTVDKPYPFRAIDSVDIIWVDATGKEISRETKPVGKYCLLCMREITPIVYSTYEEFHKALGSFYYRLGEQAAPWGFGWLAGRIVSPLPCAIDSTVEGGFKMAKLLSDRTRDQFLKLLGDTTAKIDKMASEFTAKVNETFSKLTTNMKEILDKYGKTLVDQINVGYAKFKGEIDVKVGRTLEAQKAEIARWCEEVNRAFATETENARRALIEATENIKKMEGLREGVLATPVSVRMVTPTFFEIEAIEGAQYDYIAIGP